MPFLAKNFVGKMLLKKLLTAGSGPGFFQGSDPDTIQNVLDPKNCY
jgi:hypothetical protein